MREILLALVLTSVVLPNLWAYDSAKKETLPSVQTDSSSASSVTAKSKDGKAEVQAIEGKAVLIQSGNPVEKNIQIGDEISAGDSIYTQKGASVSINFDDQNLNTVKIPADSQVVFTSIEPTTLELKNGSVFSAVDGLPAGSTWKISTAAAVVAVRGTQFEVDYSESSGEFSTATYDDDNTSKESAVLVQAPAGGEAVQIIEGREMSFKRGQPLAQNLIKKMTPQRMQRGQKLRQETVQHRRKMIEQKKKRDNERGGQGPGGPGGPGGKDPGEPRDGSAGNLAEPHNPLKMKNPNFPGHPEMTPPLKGQHEQVKLPKPVNLVKPIERKPLLQNIQPPVQGVIRPNNIAPVHKGSAGERKNPSPPTRKPAKPAARA